WMLAGGLTPENAAEATRRTGATQLDLSSGVEDMPGVKSAQKMRSFMDAVTRR
ncbi:MAG: phosphoribosylanthranilate isomerase, partial [Shimia sp.]